MSDLKSLLGDKEPDTEKPEATQAEPEVEADEAETEEQPDGAEAEAEPSAEAKPDDKPKKPREQRSVPLAAFLEVQNKLKAELEDKAKKLAEFEAKQKAQPDFNSFFKKPPEKIPSVYEDEQGFANASQQYMQAESFNTRFGMSANYAVRTFGQDKVSEAVAAFQQAAQSNPVMQQMIEASFDPVGEIVGWHQTQTTLRKIEAAGGLEAYEKKLRADIEAELKASMAKQPDADDEDEDEPVQKPNLPSNFNKAAKGGNRSVPATRSLKDLLA